MVTLKDIASRAGVSMMTVSRVMNGNQGKVSEKTAARIRALAEEMGYIPNSSARSLAAKSSRIIAVILRDSPFYNPLEDPHASSFLGLITKEVQKRGYYVMIHFVEDFSDITFRLRSWNTEGAIFLGLFDEEVRQIQSGNHIPLVFTDSYSCANQLINIGVDDFPVSDTLPVPLTTIRQDLHRKAAETCRILFEHIEDPASPCESVILDVRLIERDSVKNLT